MEEIWRKKQGFSNYFISNYGRVKSSKTEKIKTLRFNEDGYVVVSLCSDNKSKKVFRVHRLVGELFCENPNDYPQINHKDGDKQNNVYTNLEWVTAEMNVQHAILNEIIRTTDNTNVCVDKLDLNGDVVGYFKSISSAAKSIGVKVRRIRNCCAGRTRSCGGFKWRISNQQIKIYENYNHESFRSTPKQVKVTNLIDGCFIVYNSINSASKAFNISSRSVERYCSGKVIPKNKSIKWEFYNSIQ